MKMQKRLVVVATLALLNGCLDAEPEPAAIPAGEQVPVGENNGDTLLIEGDIVIPANRPEPERTQLAHTASNLWPTAVIPYEFDPAVNATTQQNVLGAMEPWRQAGFTFRARTSADTAFVRITTGHSPTNQWSCAATIGFTPGANTYHAGSACSMRDYVHEWGHVIGLHHEHCRADSGQYVIHNHVCNFVGDSVGPYDFDSIMHYDAFGRNADGTINEQNVRIQPRDGRSLYSFGFNDWPSAGDISTVQSMYGVAERPLAPVAVTTTWDQCYGRNRVTWATGSNNVQYWEAMKRPFGTTTWTRAYSGTIDSFTINVTTTTALKVRACNWVGCSAYTETMPAVYYPLCYVP